MYETNITPTYQVKEIHNGLSLGHRLKEVEMEHIHILRIAKALA